MAFFLEDMVYAVVNDNNMKIQKEKTGMEGENGEHPVVILQVKSRTRTVTKIQYSAVIFNRKYCVSKNFVIVIYISSANQ